MINNLRRTYYLNLFLSINVAKNKNGINIAKPVLLLSILKGIEGNTITENKIYFNKELISCYRHIYSQYRTTVTPPEYPYYYLNSESFYTIVGSTNRKTPSAKFLREEVQYSMLDGMLWQLLQNSDVRQEFSEAIITHFLNK